jgi:hypothetical protein
MHRVDVFAPSGPLIGDEQWVGWFDLDAATAYDEGTWGDGVNQLSSSHATGSSMVHEQLHRTGDGRWVLHWWSQWYGGFDRWSFVTDGSARDWLLANGHDTAVEEHFGPIEPKRGPGRPPIGRPVQVRLPAGLLTRLDAWADRNGPSRAEAVRILLDAALISAEQADPGSTQARVIRAEKLDPGSTHPTHR